MDMKNLNILPADTYTVINKTILDDTDHKILTMLYQPIIGYQAISLYESLKDDLDKQGIISEEYTHHHLMSTMQLSLQEIIVAREKLEGIGLLKTYIKEENTNNYVYLLYSPLTPEELFNHPILNIVLYNNIGKQEYDKLINYFKTPRINIRGYNDITKSFDDVFSSIEKVSMDTISDISKKQSNNIEISKGIDFNELIASIPDSEITEKTFNSEIKSLINSLSFIYNIKTYDMINLVRNSLNEKGQIDKTNLRKSCRNYYQFEHDGSLPTLIYKKQPDYLKKPTGDNSKWAQMVYTLESVTPYELLKSTYKGAEPTDRDKKLIESLLIDQKLSPGVVNVIIAYTLKTNNEKLTKSYVETIAGQLKRLNVETVEEAMRVTEKEHKKMNRITKKTYSTKPKVKEELPNWFEQEPEKQEVTQEESQEMEDILKELV
jgi:replication initiation and membrane attachment protein